MPRKVAERQGGESLLVILQAPATLANLHLTIELDGARASLDFDQTMKTNEEK